MLLPQFLAVSTLDTKLWIGYVCTVVSTHSGIDTLIFYYSPGPNIGVWHLFINVRKFLRQIAFTIFINGENLC